MHSYGYNAEETDCDSISPCKKNFLKKKNFLEVLDHTKACLVQKMDIQTPEGDGNCGIEDDQQTRDIRTDQHSNE